YPVLINESVYVLNDDTDTKIEDLNQIITVPIVVVFSLEQLLANPENATEMFERLNITLPPLPPEEIPDFFFSLLSFIPFENITVISGVITETFEAIGETMLDQVAVAAVRIEYDIIGMNTEDIQNLYILKAGGLMLLMTLLAVICTIAVSYLASRTAAGMARDIRSDVFKKIENFSSTEFDKFSTASLITRSTNDVTQIQSVTYMIVRMVFYAPILGVGGVIRALNKSTSMWWIIAVAVLVLVVLIVIVFFIALPKFQAMQKLTDRINLVARESLSGMLVIRAFNKEKFEEKRFDKANLDITAVILFINRLMVILMPFMMLVLNGLSLGIIWIGAHQVAEAAMQVGDMMAFMQYAMQIVFAFLMMSMMF
ncbi:MAG: ABC transporter ATP-binding protein, partial [Candidatus Heimdallarchaeota archaeon]|nr:ABC transporter ATP-binding protein [Candidatus Heimdallarchaeota archaeon]